MRRLRILHLVANRWWTGAAAPALDLAVALRDRGHDVLFACIRGGALEARARAVGLPPAAGLSLAPTVRPWILRGDVGALRELARERRLDIAHAHQSHDHWLAALAFRGRATRLVRTVHHRRAVRGDVASRWLFRRTQAVVAVSEAIAEAARGARLARGPLTVVPGAVDIGRFSARADGTATRAELGLEGRPVIGCVARLVPGRGHDLLLQAVSRLRGRIPALRVLLVGRGEGRPALERLVRELGLENHVVFAGYRGEDLPVVLAAMDCFVLLGSGSEESCRAVLEAMAVGRPVIAGRAGAMPETVVDGVTGWVVDGSPELVAERLARLLSHPAEAGAMGAAGRRRVEALFTIERRALAVEQVYARVLGDEGLGAETAPRAAP